MDKQFKIKNYMEDLVLNQLEDIMKDNNCSCFCERCKLDIMALALNNLPTKYVTTEHALKYNKLALYESQCSIDVITQITNAIKVVEKNPRHNV